MLRQSLANLVEAGFLAARTQIESENLHDLVGPLPIADLRQVLAKLPDVLLMFDQLVAQELFEMSTNALQPRNPIDDIARQMEAIQVVQYRHIKRRSGRSLFLVAANVEIVVIRSPIGEAVDQPRVPVIGEDDRLIGCKHRVELRVGQTVRMLARRLKGHQVYHIHDANLNVREMLS